MNVTPKGHGMQETTPKTYCNVIFQFIRHLKTSRERKGCRRDDTIKQKERKKETVVSFYSIKKDRGSSSSSTFYSRSKQHGRIGNYFILLYVNLYGCLFYSKSLILKLTMKFNL